MKEIGLTASRAIGAIMAACTFGLFIQASLTGKASNECEKSLVKPRDAEEIAKHMSDACAQITAQATIAVNALEKARR